MTDQARIQQLERENAQLREQLQHQKDQNTQLQEQLEQLRHELEEGKRGRRVRPQRTRRRCTASSGKKPGRKRGHRGHGRPYPTEVGGEREEDHSQEHCPRCRQQVVPTGERKT